MASSGNGARLFKIEFSGQLAERIRRLQRQAARQGRGDEFLQGLGKIVKRLQRNPLKAGEAL